MLPLTVHDKTNNPKGGEFNEYVNPGSDAEWRAAASEVSGLTRIDPRIMSAGDGVQVWTLFCTWIENNIGDDEVGAVVAYNGAGNDMKWIWWLTQAPGSPFTIRKSDMLGLYIATFCSIFVL